MIYGVDLSGEEAYLRSFRSDLNGAKKAIQWSMAGSFRRLYVLRDRRFSRRSYRALHQAGRFATFAAYCIDVLENDARRTSPDELRRIYLG